MSQIDWTDILNIGLPKIDEQHKKLIGLSNSLILAMINGKGADVIGEAVSELHDYTCTHFADEEAYMEEIGYPQLDAQKKAHASLTAKVGQLRERIENDKSTSPNEVLDFINDWIITHIMDMDARISLFAKGK